jgi:glycosyltransferase involved in cell wall biosynthesis
MKIAMVSEHASPLAALGGVDAGGQNVHVDALSTELARRGHDVTVFTRRDSTSLPATISMPGGYAVHHVPAGPPSDIPKDEIWPYMGAFGEYLAGVLDRERFDVAHAHFWMSGAATMEAAAAAGIPWAQTFHALGSVKRRHQGNRDTSPPGRIDVEREICRTADVVIATCRDEVAELGRLGLPERRARIIPCGVDPRRFVARPIPGRRQRRKLLTVGRLVERKGVADVIQAVAEIPDTTLVIAGGPSRDALDLDPEVERLKTIAADAGCGSRLEFLGAVDRDHMPGVMQDADVVVAAPWYEPFGIVPLEAMATGRPVVGTAVGGLLDTVVPGLTGELVPPRDPAALAAALGSLLQDDERRRAYGMAGVERVRSAYTWERVAERTEHALAALVPTNASLEVTP